MPDAGALHGVTSATVPTLNEKGTLDFTFGIRLIPVPAAVDPNPADDNQLPDPTPLHDPDLERQRARTPLLRQGREAHRRSHPLRVRHHRQRSVRTRRSLVRAGHGSRAKPRSRATSIDPATTASRVTLESLLAGVSATPAALTTAGALSGTPKLELTVVSAGPSGIVPALSGNPTITLQPSIQPPQTSPQKVDARYVFSPASFTASTDFNNALSKFANLDAGDIVAALQEAEDYLGRIATLGQLGEPIPALGVSAAGLANIAGALDATIASLDANPPSSFSRRSHCASVLRWSRTARPRSP